MALRPFVTGSINEKRVKDAKTVAVFKYHKCSESGKDNDLSDHSQKIKRVYQTLCEFIRRSDQILASLFQERAVTQQERDLIRSQTTEHQWVSHLLEVLCAKPGATYQCFLQALNDTGQHHLYRLLEEEDYELNVVHKITIIDNFKYLKENITLSDPAILDSLFGVDVLDQHEVAEIKSKVTDHERTDQLLQFILRTSHEQYIKFLQCLKNANHKHVYVKLSGANDSHHNTTRPLSGEDTLTKGIAKSTMRVFDGCLGIVGDGTGGKSTLADIFQTNQFSDLFIPGGRDPFTVTIDADSADGCKMVILDTWSQEEYYRTREIWYPFMNVVILCFSVVYPDGLENIRTNWVPEVRHFLPNVPLILVGNMIDLRNDEETLNRLTKKGKKPVSREEGEAMAKTINAYTYLECSCKTMQGVHEILETAARIILERDAKSRSKCLIM